MLRPSSKNLIFTVVISLLFFAACRPVSGPVYKVVSVDSLISAKVGEGNRLVEINSDSLKIVSQALYDLYKVSRRDSVLVYADLFESTYYWNNSAHRKAIFLAIKSLVRAQKAGLTNTLPRIYLLISGIENEIKDYRIAFAAIKVGLDSAAQRKDTASIIALRGMAGMLTRGEGVAKKSDSLLNRSLQLSYAALQMAESDPKYEWLKIRLFNTLGQCYANKSDFKQAIAFFEKAIPLAVKYNQPLSLIRSYCKLGDILYYLGQRKEGISYLKNALKLAREHRATFWLLETTEAIYKCYVSSKDYELGMRYQIENRNIRDSLKALTDVRHIGELRLMYEAEKKDKEIHLLNAKNKLETLLLYGSALVVILLSVIAALLYLKQEKEKKLLQAEKSLLDDELQRAEIELKSFTENLKGKNSMIEEFKSRIEHLQLQNTNREDVESMEHLLKAHIMTDESWERFKRLFDKVHPLFFVNLKIKMPGGAGNLTATDTRILVLIKLGLSNLEMANLSGITIEGIKKSKQRLRKKLGLDAAQNLASFVDNI